MIASPLKAEVCRGAGNLVEVVCTLIVAKKLPPPSSDQQYAEYPAIPWAEADSSLPAGEHDGIAYTGVTGLEVAAKFRAQCGIHFEAASALYPPKPSEAAPRQVAGSSSGSVAEALKALLPRMMEEKTTGRALPDDNIDAARIVLGTLARVWQTCPHEGPATPYPVLPMLNRLMRWLDKEYVFCEPCRG